MNGMAADSGGSLASGRTCSAHASGASCSRSTASTATASPPWTIRAYERMTLGEFARECGYGQDFLDLYILPMGSAVWSTPPDRMLDFPARTLMHFWFNHGFLAMHTRRQWWTVCDGSRQYVRKLIPPFADQNPPQHPHHENRAARRSQVIVQPRDGPAETFDKVILATHTPPLCACWPIPHRWSRRSSPPFQYQSNKATLHTDEQFMPKTRRCWASWNYRIDTMHQARSAQHALLDEPAPRRVRQERTTSSPSTPRRHARSLQSATAASTTSIRSSI
jgi:predicted NAD/FAD-binding protein